MNWLNRLLASDDRGADSVIVGGLLGLVTLCSISAGLAIVDHSSWSPGGFSLAFVGILGAMGGTKAVRDRFSPTPTQTTEIKTEPSGATVATSEKTGA